MPVYGSACAGWGVLWPDTSPDFGGEVWCVEAELTPKTAERTAGIMSDLLGRTADYGEDAGVRRRSVRYARVLYVCSRRRGGGGAARGQLPGC